MPDAGAGAHALDIAGVDGRAVAHAVLVRKAAFEHVADDLHIPMPVRTEPLAGGDAVFVDHPQRAELHVLRIVVACN